ncbi:MAG TPA: Na+/H+ antiporter subunit E [Thermoanaerobaculia bacterium]|nr:Na+/H+ antiporter subunit E [Thermoanaerobaculia bacterium]
MHVLDVGMACLEDVVRHSFLLPLLLAVLWLALSGRYSTEPIVLTMGVLSVALVWWLSTRMDRTAGEPGLPREAAGMLRRAPAYLVWLAWQVARANLSLARVVVDPRRRLEPRLLRVRARQRSALGQVIHANSLTLTPGTITLDLRGGELLVHALTARSGAGVLAGHIDRAVTRLEGGG